MRIRIPRCILAVLAFSWIATTTPAQEVGTQSSGADERYSELETAFKDAIKKDREAQAKAYEEAMKSGAKSLPAMRMGPPKELVVEYIGAFKSTAKKFEGTEDAIPFLMWIARMGSSADQGTEVGSALDVLTTTHVRSASLSELPMTVARLARSIGKERASEILSTLEHESPHVEVTANAILYRVMQELQSAPTASNGYQNARKEALRAMSVNKAKDFVAMVQGVIDGRESLTEGGDAADIAGVDLDGVKFKLSDYRGKIIMLDFWGNW